MLTPKDLALVTASCQAGRAQPLQCLAPVSLFSEKDGSHFFSPINAKTVVCKQ